MMFEGGKGGGCQDGGCSRKNNLLIHLNKPLFVYMVAGYFIGLRAGA